MQGSLGEFEVVVIIATLHLGGGAFGSAVRNEIERRTGRPVSRGAVYVTLDRLERKGLLSSRRNARFSSGGRQRRRAFRVRSAGLKALKTSLSMLARMLKGLEPLLGDV